MNRTPPMQPSAATECTNVPANGVKAGAQPFVLISLHSPSLISFPWKSYLPAIMRGDDAPVESPAKRSVRVGGGKRVITQQQCLPLFVAHSLIFLTHMPFTPPARAQTHAESTAMLGKHNGAATRKTIISTQMPTSGMLRQFCDFL